MADDFREKLQKYATYSPQEVKEAPIQELIGKEELKLVGSGTNARIFSINNGKWVVKEGKWDIKMDLFGERQLDIPRAVVQKVLDLWSFTFFPDKEEIARQYRLYLSFTEYLGYFDFDKGLFKKSKGYYYHPNRDLMFSAQRAIRNSLVYYLPQLEKFYNFKFVNRERLEKILLSKHVRHNFVPEEYLLYGNSISPENKGKKTYFIFQEFVKGDLLHDVPTTELSWKQEAQIIILLYLLLLMNYQLHIVPDTRPRSVSESLYWFTKTDNIIVAKNGLKFIDTRWFWETNSLNPTKKGFVVADHALNVYKRTINKLLKKV